MTDSEIQRNLNRLAKLCNELVTESHARYGPDGQLFYESEGSFHMMDGDSQACSERQNHIRFSSSGVCRLQIGSW